MSKTHDYIACRPDSAWAWDHPEPYIVLKNGGTIAHWNEVKHIVVAIADLGLPLFDLLVVLLAACDKSEFSRPAERLSEHFVEVCDADSVDSLDILFILQEMDIKHKTGEQRLLLLATLLQKAHITLILAVSKRIAKDLISDTENSVYIDTKGIESKKHQARIVNCLRILGNHFKSEEDIVEAMAEYDLDALQTLDVDVFTSDKKENEDSSLTLEEQLLEDIRTKKLAELIPHVLAGMNFPIVAKKSDDRPEGGVSDLANKGHFDQLVVTEYAYPDDLFASRIVNNEALFVQREKAKDDQDENYCLLIDSSLYSWGVPKFIGCAITCCIGIKNPDAKLSTFMLGDNLTPTNFRTKEGIIQALKITNSSINPSAGLLEFASREDTYSSVMLITSRKALNQTAMAEFRNVYGGSLDFITTINQDAEVHINRLKGKEVASFQLNLDEIWSNKAKEQKITHQVDEYSDSFPPVRVPIRTDDIYRSTRNEDTFYFVGRNYYLVKADWNELKRDGGKAGILVKKIFHPFDFMSEIGINPKGEKELLLFSEAQRMVFIHNLHTEQVREFHFIHWKYGRNMGGKFMHDGDGFVFASTSGFYRFDKNFDPTADYLTNRTFDIPTENQATEENWRLSSSWNYYKNIKHCKISGDGALYLGERILMKTTMDGQSFIEFDKTPYFGHAVMAAVKRLGKDRLFTFKNGAAIKSYSYGVLEFSFPEGSELVGYEIILKNPGPSKLETTKAIRIHSPMGLKESKEFLDEGGTSITFVSNLQKAKEIHGALSYAGAEVEINKTILDSCFYMVPLVDSPPVFASDKFFSGRDEFKLEIAQGQRTIKSADFYNLYFALFIDRILNYAD